MLLGSGPDAIGAVIVMHPGGHTSTQSPHRMQSSGESITLSKHRRQRKPSRRASLFVVAGLDLAEADAPLGGGCRDRPARDRVVVAVEAAEAAPQLDANLVARCDLAARERSVDRRRGSPPSAIASMRLRGPFATSPPAQICGCDVRSVCSSTCTPPARVRSSSSGPRKDTSAAWPTARITVSAGCARRCRPRTTGAKRPCSSNTDATATVSRR